MANVQKNVHSLEITLLEISLEYGTWACLTRKFPSAGLLKEAAIRGLLMQPWLPTALWSSAKKSYSFLKALIKCTSPIWSLSLFLPSRGVFVLTVVSLLLSLSTFLILPWFYNHVYVYVYVPPMFLSVPYEHFKGKNQVLLIYVFSKAINKSPS